MAILSRQRIYAFLLIVGASILLYRTITMIFFDRAFEYLVLWVFILLVVEFSVDISCIAGSIRWLISNSERDATFPLQLGAAATLLHAVRVLIYVLGRTGPWVNFDVKPSYHALYSFDWFWVWFAAALSALSIIGVIIIWRIRRR